MNSEFVTLSDEQLEMVTGGDQVANATAASDQSAVSINPIVAATQARVGNISQSAIDIAVAAIINRSFNHSFNA